MKQLRARTKAARKKPAKKIKLNNKGMSLVEVIIAITILSVVVVPVMHSLTTAAYYNLRARNRQNVTFTAESLMEMFKGYDIFDSSSSTADTDTLEWLISDNGRDTLKNMIGVDEIGTITSNIDTVRNSGHGGSAGTVEFKINDVKLEDGKLYDIDITAEPGKVQDIFELENFSDSEDAIFVGPPAGMDEAFASVKNDFLEKYCTQGGGGDAEHAGAFISAMQEIDARGEDLTTDDIADVIDKRLKIKSRDITYIINSASDVKCEISYTYGIEDIEYLVPKEEESSSDEESSSEEGDEGIERETETDIGTEVEFEKEEKKLSELEFAGGDGIGGFASPAKFAEFFGSLTTEPNSDGTGDFVEPTGDGMFKRLFIYYYPAYRRINIAEMGTGDWSDYNGDTITIKDGGAGFSKLECYLIKQSMLKDASFTNGLEAGELDSCEQIYAPVVKNDTGKEVWLYHNLNENIAGVTGIHPTISPSGFTIAKEYSADDFVNKEKVLVYTLTIDVKDKNGNIISTLTGSMNEKLVNIGENVSAP